MSKMFITSDLHLGHKNAFKWRPFQSPEEHDEVIWDNLCSTVGKRDSVIFLGDVAFAVDWLERIKSLDCVSKTLILGNHDTDNKDCARLLWDTYDKVHSLMYYKKTILSHCPIHESEFRGRVANIHGHTHERVVESETEFYYNVCLEHTEYKPLDFSIIKKFLPSGL